MEYKIVLFWLDQEDIEYISGTSIATAFVSAAAGLLLSQDNSLSSKQLKELLTKNVSKIDTLSECTASGGYLNVYQALVNM